MRERHEVDWDYFDRFESLIDTYMLPRGEGETMASQTVTAVNKLIYMYYNNGDIFDNTTGWVQGFCNDITSYANWLYIFVSESREALNGVFKCHSEADYTLVLKNVADTLLKYDFLEALNEKPKAWSIYDAEGKFRLVERSVL